MKKLLAKVLGIGISASMILTAMPAGTVHAAVTKDDTVNMLGNAHIDAAWNWRYREVESNYLPSTVKRALDNMNNNSDYHFSFSSSQFYQWMQEYWPELVPQVKNKVKSGQWEITGGQVIEPDLNNESGESLVRQSLFGQNYFRDNYGTTATVGWVPDVFGFSYQVPQILKKSGMNDFVTTKLNWNDTNKWPYEYFNWTSPDGSTVTSYKPTNDYSMSGGDINSSKLANTLTYPMSKGLSGSLVLYGAGDNGGGPTSSDISNIQSINANTASGAPSVKMNRADTVFADLDSQVKANQSSNPTYQVPDVNNELYFEYHRGVMTTADPMKKYNRYSEEAAETAEKFSSVAALLGTEKYPQEKINEAWQKTLLNQFHDVLPGSALESVYKDAFNNAEIAENQFNSAKNTALSGIASRIDTEGEGQPIVLTNTLSWDRTDIAQVEVNLASPNSTMLIIDPSGKEIPSQFVKEKDTKALVSFEAAVPAMGYSLYRAVEKANAQYATTLSVDDTNKVIENKFFKVTIDKTTGNISSIIDKSNNNKEVVDTTNGQEFNRLQFLSDTPKEYESWNIDYDDMTATPTEANTASSVTLVEQGPTKATFKVSKVSPSGASTIDEYMTLYNNINRIDMEMKINWNEKQTMLKVALPVSVHPQNVTYDIAYGTIQRPAADTKGMFEVEGYKFADMSDNGYGVSILSDSKEGWDCPNGVLRLSLLRSATDGRGGTTDQGLRDIKYSIYPHSGDFKAADTELKSYEYNYPVTSVKTTSHHGDLAAATSFGKVATDDNNVIMSVFKKAEVRGIDKKNGEDRSRSYIIRLAETEGKDGSQATVTLPAKITSAQEVNLIEDAVQGASAPTINGSNLITTLNKYEIKTFLVTFDNSIILKNQIVQSKPIDLSAAYNLDGMSYNSNRKDGDYTGQGETISADLMPNKVTSEDVTYNIGPKADGKNNIVQASGQKIDIPNAGNHQYLFMLGNSTNGLGLGQFSVNYTDGTSASKTFNFAGWKDTVGYAQQSYIKDTIGLNLSHTHTPNGDTYDVQNNFFVYRMPLDSTKTISSITLPNVNSIKIAAMSFVDGNVVLAEDQQAPSQVKNVQATGSKKYYNTSINLTWDAATDNDNIDTYYVYRGLKPDLSDAALIGTTADTKYTDSNFNIINKYYYAVCAQDPTGNIGPMSAIVNIYAGINNIALFKPVTVDGQMNSSEAGSMINDGDTTTKWCYNNHKADIHWAIIDLGKSQDISGFKLYHAGSNGENTGWNTRAYTISVSTDNSIWTPVKTVTDNTENVTENILSSRVNGRYVKLEVNKPANNDDVAARIYEFQVYGDDECFPTAVPNAPAINSIVQSNTSAILSFTPDSNTDSCTIKYGTQPGVYDKVVTNVIGNSATISNLSIGKTYYFTVIPHNAMGDGVPSGASLKIMQNIGVTLDLTNYFNLDGISTVGENPVNKDGFDGGGYAYDGAYIPATIQVPGTTFALGQTTGSATNVIQCKGQNIALPGSTTAKSIFILESSTNGPVTDNITVNYSDGNSEKKSVTFTDWCVSPPTANESIVFKMDHRIQNAGTTGPTCYIFSQSIPVDSTKQIKSISLPKNDKMKIFALALTTLVDPDTLSHDAFLSSINIGDIPLAGFDKNTFKYDVTLPYTGTTGSAVTTTESAINITIPTVTAVAETTSAAITVTQALSISGSASIAVAAQDGMTINNYTINFNDGTVPKSSDATLSDLKVDGTTVTDFDPDMNFYYVTLPAGTTQIPNVQATTTTGSATKVVNQAAGLPGAATVVVTAEDGTVNTYKVTFTVEGHPAAPAKLSTVKLSVDNSTIERMKTANATVTGTMDDKTSADLSKATVKYYSKDSTIASISDNGVITANNGGSTTIYAVVTLDGVEVTSNSVTITVTVTKPSDDDSHQTTGGGSSSVTGNIINVSNTDTASVVSSINSAPGNAVINLDVTGNKQVGEEIFNAIKGTDKTVIFEQNGIQWTFKGKDITGDTKAIDTTVRIATINNSTSSNRDAIAGKLNNGNALVISFANNGQLPGKAAIKIKLDAQMLSNLDKNNLNVYYYNETTKTMETVASGLKVDADGYIQFDITHNSDYIISDQGLSAAQFVRLSGSDRYETCVKISQSAWKTSDYAVLATGEDFPDALSAAPLAKKYNAPILITNHESLNTSVEKEIERLGVKNIFVIGGTGAVSQGIEDKLTSNGIKCTRIKGSDRYETSAAIAGYIGASKEVVVATGANFPDALSIASYAALKGMPILLTKSSSLPDSISKYIAKSGVTKSYVIGGTGVINDSVLNALPGGERLNGNDRYATNVTILEKFASEFNLSSIYFATGENFPDALTGSALAASMKAPIILVNSNVTNDTSKFIKENISKIKTGYALGGSLLVPDSVKSLLTK